MAMGWRGEGGWVIVRPVAGRRMRRRERGERLAWIFPAAVSLVALVGMWGAPWLASGLSAGLMGLAAVMFPAPRRMAPWVILPLWILLLAPLTVLFAAAVFGGIAGEGGSLFGVQPWVIGRWLPFYYTGLLLAWWLLGRVWEEAAVRSLLFVIGGIPVLLLVGSVVALFFGEARLTPGLSGPFRSPNSFGFLMALGAVAWATLVLFERRWVVGSIGLFACLAGALLAQSRAGVFLLLLGVLGMFVVRILVERNLRLLGFGALGVALCMVLVALAQPKPFREVANDLQLPAFGEGFRLAVQEDAGRMAASRPVTGYGLGHFDAVFPQFRTVSAREFRAEHAESDVLHFAAEVGWVATVTALILAGYVAVRLMVTLFRDPTTGGFVAGMVLLLFGVHIWMDESAHQAGLCFLGMLGVSLGWNPVKALSGGRPMRLAGGLLLGGAVLWLLAFRSYPFPAPGLHWDERSEPPPEAAYRWAEARLAVAPLDWRAKELAAHARLTAGDYVQADALFEELQQLEPFSTATAEREARAWLAAGESDRAGAAVARLLARSDPELRRKRFLHYLPASQDAGYRQALISGAGKDEQLRILAVLQADTPDPAELAAAVRQQLEAGDSESRILQLLLVSGSARLGPEPLRAVVPLLPGLQSLMPLLEAQAAAAAGQHADASDRILEPAEPEGLPAALANTEGGNRAAIERIHTLLAEGATTAAVEEFARSESSLTPAQRQFIEGWILTLYGRDLEAWQHFDAFIRLQAIATSNPR